MKRSSVICIKCELFFTLLKNVDKCRFKEYNILVAIVDRICFCQHKECFKLFVPKM